MQDLTQCSGPYRRVSPEEFEALTAQGISGEWTEGAGHVVYDEQARTEFKRKLEARQ